ncbi:hypothetical protein FOZ63_022584, partial [Perkinsus olseni]
MGLRLPKSSPKAAIEILMGEQPLSARLIDRMILISTHNRGADGGPIDCLSTLMLQRRARKALRRKWEAIMTDRVTTGCEPERRRKMRRSQLGETGTKKNSPSIQIAPGGTAKKAMTKT